MVNLLEILYGITIGAGLVTLLAWIQSRAPGRADKYRRRFRLFRWITLGAAVGAMVLFQYLSRKPG